MTNAKNFGTAPVFFTAIATILGAILFLRFGFATGKLGFWGVMGIIALGHLVTIPTALAISEIATNKRVEGGGEYFIISRSFGLNVGATIGFALFLSQAISVAFYVIAFTEAFEFLFEFLKSEYNLFLPRQAISIPVMILLSVLILIKGANMGVKTLYIVVGILLIALLLFFMGQTPYSEHHEFSLLTAKFKNSGEFFMVFAIIFPAFTGMTAGVGLSGELKKPSRSIPLGTTLATVSGMIMYVFIAWKLASSSPDYELINNQLVMADIALWGKYVIPLGLAASTISSAIGSVMVAPRTLQALSLDNSFPSRKVNNYLASTKKSNNEPFHATLITCSLAIIFVALGDVDAVAEIISMFFMVTYGAVCLISFLYHFGSDPSYRPSFKSKWYISLLGFIMAVWLMFKINAAYAVSATIIMIGIYLYVNYYHKNRKGLEAIMANSIFQLSRNLQVYIQRKKTNRTTETWRPSAICVSNASFKRDKAFKLLDWISYKYGFGTYIHLINGYYSKATYNEAKEIHEKLLYRYDNENNQVFINVIISPSYTSAIAQSIQLPGVSGMENNMVIFDYDRKEPDKLQPIIDNYSLANAGNFDISILGCSQNQLLIRREIHVWIRTVDFDNSNLMILLSFIILGHPDWKKAHMRIFEFCTKDKIPEIRTKLAELIQTGRLPITPKNVEIIEQKEGVNMKAIINEKSSNASLVIIGFRGDHLKHEGVKLFEGYDELGDILFVNSNNQKDLS